MRSPAWRPAVPVGLLAFALMLLPKVAAAGYHSGDGAFYFIVSIFLIGAFFLFGFAFVLVGNIMALVRKKPSLVLGVLAVVLGGIDVLSSLSLIFSSGKGPETTGVGLLMGGVFCYLGYRNIDLARKQRAQAESLSAS